MNQEMLREFFVLTQSSLWRVWMERKHNVPFVARVMTHGDRTQLGVLLKEGAPGNQTVYYVGVLGSPGLVLYAPPAAPADDQNLALATTLPGIVTSAETEASTVLGPDEAGPATFDGHTSPIVALFLEKRAAEPYFGFKNMSMPVMPLDNRLMRFTKETLRMITGHHPVFKLGREMRRLLPTTSTRTLHY